MQVPSTLKETFINWRTFPFVEEASIDVLLLHIFAICLRNKKKSIKQKRSQKQQQSIKRNRDKKERGGCKCKDLVILSATMKSTYCKSKR
jgi:hypothetical protein